MIRINTILCHDTVHPLFVAIAISEAVILPLFTELIDTVFELDIVGNALKTDRMDALDNKLPDDAMEMEFVPV